MSFHKGVKNVTQQMTRVDVCFLCSRVMWTLWGRGQDRCSAPPPPTPPVLRETRRSHAPLIPTVSPTSTTSLVKSSPLVHKASYNKKIINKRSICDSNSTNSYTSWENWSFAISSLIYIMSLTPLPKHTCVQMLTVLWRYVGVCRTAGDVSVNWKEKN